MAVFSQEYIQQIVAALVPDWDAVGNVTYLEGGYSNANYAFTHGGDRYVLRIPRLAQPYVDRVREHAWYADLPDDIGVRPIALNANNGQMISPWVEGELLVDVWHRFTVDDLLSYLKGLHARLPGLSVTYDVAELSQAFWPHGQLAVSAEPPTVLATCHNDLNPWNIIVTDSGWLTLDWEFVGANDPLFDLVALHQGLELPAADLPELAVSYLAGAATPEEAMRRLARAERNFWIRELGWAEFQLRHGNVREEIRDQVATARRRLEFLD